MKAFTCPYCYGKHDLLTSGVKCSYNIPGKTDKCVGAVVKDANGWIPNSDKVRCMRCTAAKKSVFCPVVNKEIPSDFLNEESLSIALLGAKASGKSNYIGVLINEIKRKMTGSFNCTLSLTSSEESRQYYNDHYYEPLFKQGTVVDATSQADIPPLIFPLRFLDNKNRIGKVVALSFYDTAGENLDSTDDMVVYNRYVPNSNGIILLLDPLQITAVREKLKGVMTLPPQNTDVIEVLSRVIQNIREVRNLKGTKKINIPLALVFTKIDVLEQGGIIDDGSCLRFESEHLNRGLFVETDFENVNIGMQDLLENWLDSELVQQMKNFEKYAFFGVTSLGGNPKGSNLSGGKINPRRVLDPLLWVLAQNKYIKRVKK